MTSKLAAAAALVAGATLLPGCFPLAVTSMGAAAVMATDRRTTGIYIEDESIEWKAVARLRQDSRGAHVNATSYNRRVLLTGEAPTADEKKRIEDVVKSIPNVREVINEISVGNVTSLTTRGNDALVTSNVKARMVNAARFSPTHVKVVTENGVVYLMGMVTATEAEAAVEVARNTQGAKSVVKVFEIVG